ncbi:transcription initiation factor IIB 2, partial [Halobacteriales archaeon QS_5_70_17]
MSDMSIRRNTGDREREEENDEQERAEREDEGITCPECGGDVVSDAEHGETVCEDCGLVVEE